MVEGSLERLQLTIDLYQLHGTDPVTSIDRRCGRWMIWRRQGAAWRLELAAFAHRCAGIAERKGFARFETVQSYYSIAGRDLEREIRCSMRKNLA
jgi:aryl-alcohol dehydrogenase-like predicted oxidoreductase